MAAPPPHAAIPDGRKPLGGGHAKGGITLQGHSITVNGRAGPVTGDDLGQRLQFNATVNSTGLLTANASFTATAKADVIGGLSLLPRGVLLSEGYAIVDIKCDTRITAQSVALAAEATITSPNKTQSLFPADSAADRAVAVSTITGTATSDARAVAERAVWPSPHPKPTVPCRQTFWPPSSPRRPRIPQPPPAQGRPRA